MKRFFKSTQLLVAILFLAILFLPSCVAKKKFIEMESSRTRAENRVRELTNEVSSLRTEFNEFNNQFHFNNTGKDHFIDSLNKIIVGLNSDLFSKNENIEDQIFSFQIEKRRLNQLLAEKDREMRNQNRSVDMLEIQIKDIKKEMNDLTIHLRNSESSANTLERQIQLKENEISRLNVTIERNTKEIGKLKSDIAAKNEQIESLQNQVKLLKSQFGQN